MGTYENQVQQELHSWQVELLKRPSLWDRSSKKIQNKVNGFIPAKVHDVVTKSIKSMVHATLLGSEYTSKKNERLSLSLRDSDKRADVLITTYKRTAALEGIGTGAGGLLLSLADFPLLLSIKMKFLFAIAAAYGMDVRDYRERLFILYIFQFAYGSPFRREELYQRINDYHQSKESMPSKEDYLTGIDWQALQQDYRDHIDLAKLLQLIPGFGAIVGGVVNYRFIESLGKLAKNCYRLRFIQELQNRISE
ncbi:hypothetical protein A374_08419 [Fictibacillus macauensis ZFHKF-1]|uniref:EcsC family protein n=1 Tax=Fictibacillus macauensis ZFHKF-1 TaxID=1196324 RepID=I8UG19_9BACL|nr:EcsC family protein [Fictibacillus macauensis]EIT85845.1 hypothetical protein A374_08419 [Fictibacillus macauensis ZFHKF-1]